MQEHLSRNRKEVGGISNLNSDLPFLSMNMLLARAELVLKK